MHQNQFGMHLGQGHRQGRVIGMPAWRVLPEDAPFKLAHQALNEARMRKLKPILANIDRAVLPGPWIDGAKPQRVQFTNVVGSKPVVSVEPVQSQILRNLQSLRLSQMHVTHPEYAQQVAQDPTA